MIVKKAPGRQSQLLYFACMQLSSSRTLESYRIFPYIAWATFIFFALFVYNITLELKEVTENLQRTTYSLEAKVDQQAGQIADVEARTRPQ